MPRSYQVFDNIVDYQRHYRRDQLGHYAFTAAQRSNRT